ncbi:hypothetical protein [Kribbella sp. NPDC048928]|uniref:hypothetical protein n=1 Tax=Kribbella sp. NPDC048928 TaxID=3364111 RepID=UPI0037110381
MATGLPDGAVELGVVLLGVAGACELSVGVGETAGDPALGELEVVTASGRMASLSLGQRRISRLVPIRPQRTRLAMKAINASLRELIPGRFILLAGT